MYTRKKLAKYYGITQSKLRRILKALQISPQTVGISSHGLPVYYYSQLAIQEIDKYLQLLKQKLQNKVKKCRICKQKVPQSNFVGTCCMDCFVKKSCAPIIYGNSWWQRTAQIPVIEKAVKYLKSFIPGPK